MKAYFVPLQKDNCKIKSIRYYYFFPVKYFHRLFQYPFMRVKCFAMRSIIRQRNTV